MLAENEFFLSDGIFPGSYPEDGRSNSPVPVFVFVSVGEELRSGQREVQGGQGQISVAKTHQLDRRSQTLVLILRRLRDNLQV